MSVTVEVNPRLDGLPAILTFPESQVEKPISPPLIAICRFSEAVEHWRKF